MAAGAKAAAALPLAGMDDDVMGLGRGSRVWYRQDASTWVLAEMRDAAAPPPPDAARKKNAPPPPATAGVTLLSGPSAGKPLDGVPVTALMPANPEVQATIPDLTQLSYLNEPSILGNLQLRYQADMIYTCAGPVLIALNPCKELPLYTEAVQHDYKSEGGDPHAPGWLGAAGGLEPARRSRAGGGGRAASSPPPCWRAQQRVAVRPRLAAAQPSRARLCAEARPPRNAPSALTPAPQNTPAAPPPSCSRRARVPPPAPPPRVPGGRRRVPRDGAGGRQPVDSHQRRERRG
jgi:hypothetical protein